ncbi:MAG: alpha/beta hydrolase family protein [Bacteroidales bacterium]
MKINKLVIGIAFLLLSGTIFAQIDMKYQLPSKEILEMADAPASPGIRLNRDVSKMILMERRQYKSLQEMAEKESRLAGLRINAKTSGPSRQSFVYGLKVKDLKSGEISKVKGMPEDALISEVRWSPNQKHIAFLNTKENGIELWVVDLKKLEANRVCDPIINNVLEEGYGWCKDSKSLLVSILPKDRGEYLSGNILPKGPIVSVNNGQKAQNRTYQDLLKNKVDEANFDYFTTSELIKVDLKGNKTPFLAKGIYYGLQFSPNGKYITVTTIQRPYSYIVPLYRFPRNVDVYDMEGNLVKNIENVPLTETLPQGFDAVRKGKRSISWRADQPASLTYVVALDGGDPEVESEYRDELFQWNAPFDKEPKSLAKTKRRYAGVQWGDDKTALLYDYFWSDRMIGTYLMNPSKENGKLKVIQERSRQDIYSDMGDAATELNDFNKRVLYIEKGRYLIMEAPGYTPKGKFPYIAKYDLKTGKTQKLWQAENKDKLETVAFIIDPKKSIMLTSIEAPTEYPNYYLRNFKTGKMLRTVTNFENPYKAMEGVHKEVIKYKRKDGVELSATLYLPKGYDKKKKEKLPMVMWAYPREFKDKAAAGQVSSSSNEFTYLWYGSPVFWVMKGYAVLDDAAFPIIGEGDQEPNDSFVEQLVSNAEAAIDAVDQLGYIDRNRVAVGGHSYGAFMTANLLTHSDLFAAGIARSGAYNRTLTPFGFQSEERNYWEAPSIYNRMSPFMNAEKMKHPLLLIHGDADNNPGTHTMQSKRYFNALKGLGANVRMVLLPFESHSYRARESVMHVLWEQDQWLDKYVKNKK